ncbi:BRISC and BRCA1-A complex member 2 [Ameca splendens]|uniref:BRISC and BRCA1-A complex member 2 n=1 Tax=Ameca splendens TaxID=208324 RepID=A0ABV0XI56_9TELE
MVGSILESTSPKSDRPTLVSFRPRTVDTMNNMSPEVALHRISPELRPLLCSVVRNGRVGLDSTNCLRVTDLKTGCTSLTPGPCCDRFKLHIPYAGETLKCKLASVL